MLDATQTILDEPALERLYTELEKPLYNVVYRWVWDSEDAHDLVQEAFVRLWKMRRQVDLDTARPLVYKIALNLASNRRRAKRIWRWVSLDAVMNWPSSSKNAEAHLSDHQSHRVVRRAVEALPERLRKVVMLCEYSDLTYESIATILGIPPGTVGSRRHKALKMLRQQLEKEKLS